MSARCALLSCLLVSGRGALLSYLLCPTLVAAARSVVATWRSLTEHLPGCGAVPPTLANVPLLLGEQRALLAAVSEMRGVCAFLSEFRLLEDTEAAPTAADLELIPLKLLRASLRRFIDKLGAIPRTGFLALRVFASRKTCVMFRVRFAERISARTAARAMPSLDDDINDDASPGRTAPSPAQTMESPGVALRVAGDVAVAVAEELAMLACDDAAPMSSFRSMTAGQLEAAARGLPVSGGGVPSILRCRKRSPCSCFRVGVLPRNSSSCASSFRSEIVAKVQTTASNRPPCTTSALGSHQTVPTEWQLAPVPAMPLRNA